MMAQLSLNLGQYSSSGVKSINQDFHGSLCPSAPLLNTKGIVVALADGISSSEVSHIASECVVRSLTDDYYATPETWSTKTSAIKVLKACNSWLYSQSRNGPHRYNLDKGYVCTLAGIIFKSHTAHLFSIGDSRIYQVHAQRLQQLTQDHRTWISAEQSYLNRAMGMRAELDIDYLDCSIQIGDFFILATDGVFEFLPETELLALIGQYRHDLNLGAKAIIEAAIAAGSDDNLTIQLVEVVNLPEASLPELQRDAVYLPFAPDLELGMSIDGFKLIQLIHNNHRSTVYLAEDTVSHQRLVFKIPARGMQQDPEFIDRFLMEEWVAKRMKHPSLMTAFPQSSERTYLYQTLDFFEGQSLAQWRRDNPEPELETVRNIIEQIARGLHSMHRQEILHQDIRPENILIDQNHTIKIIDFGSCYVAGVEELSIQRRELLQGSLLYTAPECFLGELPSIRADLYSLGALSYYLLSGDLPYGTQVARHRSAHAQRRLMYKSINEQIQLVPAWVDHAIKKACHPDPVKRYQHLSEFIFDLRHPSQEFQRVASRPLLETHPVRFWQGLSALLFALLALMAIDHPLFHNDRAIPIDVAHQQSNPEGSTP